MARQQNKIQTNDFSGGFVTEASPLSFPENSAIDILNMNINKDGSIERRNALRTETPHFPLSTPNPPDEYARVMYSYVWRNAGGISGNNFVVVQDGGRLVFYEEGDSVSSGWMYTDGSLRANATIDEPEDVDYSPVSMTDINGILVVVHRYSAPVYIEYTPENNLFPFSGGIIDFEIRDLEGLDDGLDVDHRPSNLSNKHTYNLLNQGWTTEKINTFHTSQNVYPSNADIWNVGRDAEQNFDPEELVKVDFGTSPAPKGRLLKNPFDTRLDEQQLIDSPKQITNVEFISDSAIEITAPSHGLVAGTIDDGIHCCEVYIDDLFILCGGEPHPDGNGYIYSDSFSIDGEIVLVSAIIDDDKFTVDFSGGGFFGDRCTEHRTIIYDTATINTEWSPTINTGYVTDERFRATTSYSGRIFYAGAQHPELTDKIFFTQIINNDPKKFGKCHQVADPTSEEDSQLVETDGGVISINGLGTVLDMRETSQSLVVFSTNGVWEIKGGGEGYFTAKDYSVRKITSVPVACARGVVDVEGSLMFAGEDGIYLLQANEVSLQLTAVNLTVDKIKSFYNDNIGRFRCVADGVYDYKNRRVLWFYGNGNVPSAADSTEKFFVLSNVLVHNLDTQSFTKWQFPFHWESESKTAKIMEVVAIRNISAEQSCIRIFYRHHAGNGNYEIRIATPDKPKKKGFVDLELEEVESKVITGHATMGDVGVKKSARQIIAHFLRTEKGFTENSSGGLDAVHPSGCRGRVAWNWTNSDVSNKWSPEFQMYRYNQLYMPTGTGDKFDTGYEVITTKTKLRGTGRALSIRLRSEKGKDMVLLGWSIAGDAEAHE